MVDFRQAIFSLEQMGVADVLLPFLLTFTIVFAVLNKTKILGAMPTAKRYNVIVALVMGLALVFPHVLGYYDPQSDPVNIINQSLPSVAVVAIAIVMGLLLLGVFGADVNFGGTSLASLIFFFAAGTVVYIFGTSAGFFNSGVFPRWLWFLQDPNTQSLLVMLLVFFGVIWFITKEDKDPKDKTPPFASNWLRELGGGGGGGGHGGGHH